jgi:hypothetical protein
LSVLLLCDDNPKHAPNVLEHIRALRQLSRHRVSVFNPVGIGRSRLLRLDDYDVVVVHYSIFVLEDRHLGFWFREQLANFGGLKVQFIQDEYRRVDAMTARIRELGIDVVFSSVPADAVPDVYGSRLPGVDILPTLTGYVPTELGGLPRQSLAGRPLDVVYRGRSIPYWLGKLGQDKVAIGREFLERASSTDLRCDISWTEADRIYGDAWYGFLSSSRTTLGTESGASIADFDGSLQERTERHLKTNPAATFEEVEREILAPFEGNAVIDAISPRVFEAAALGTAMVNFVGRYSEVIEPWVHYIPLEKDFSNFDDVVALIGDDAELERVASRAHADLVSSGRYSLRTLVHDFEAEIETRIRPARYRRSPVARTMRRKLAPVEQLRSPSRLAQLPFVAAVRRRADARAGRRLIARFPEIESLATEAELNWPHRQRERLLHDLVRLAAAEAAHIRELRQLGPPFDVRPELDDKERRLTLVGTRTPSDGASRLRELRGRVAAAIREKRLAEIVWDNSAVEGYLTLASFPVSSLDIGYHVVGGAHRFSALTELMRDDPDGVISALEPLFRPRPEAPVDELDTVAAAAFRVLWQPVPAATLGAATLRAALASKELRRLLRAYLSDAEARAEVPMELVLKDLFRLWLVGQTRTSLELDDDHRKLVYRTNAQSSRNGIVLASGVVRSLEQIVWDHSADSSLVTSRERPRVSVKLDGGVYEFDGIVVVGRRFPELAAPVLSWAASTE